MPVSLPANIKSVEVLRLQPGDYLICETEMPVAHDGRMRLRSELAAIFGIDEKQVCVSPHGMSLKVLRKEAMESTE